MAQLSRRSFLKSGAAALGAAAVLGANARVLGANGDVRVAVVGFNGRGKDHLAGLSKVKGVRIVALCDVDQEVLGKQAKEFEKKGEKVETYSDVRKLLESKEIDAITCATPNHWHSLITIWGCQAGKDVYVEKPISHNVFEGRKAVEAARKYNRIVQSGTQSRSNPGMREAVKFLQDGGLGKIKYVRALCYKRRDTIGKSESVLDIPKTIDFDLWSGPAALEPIHRKKLHYDWHWVWPTGNGDLGNQGSHQMDIGRWILKGDALSPQVFCIGGRVGYVDDGTTPNTQLICHTYPTAPLLFEVRGLPEKSGAKEMSNLKGASVGVVTECEGGSVVMTTYATAIVYDKDGKETKRFGFKEGKDGKQATVNGDHYANFIDAVRSRKPEDLNCEVQEGHLSAALCHTGNISYQLGKQTPQEEIRAAIKAHPDASRSLAEMEEHLAKNDINLAESKLTLGAFLEMDPKTERFTNNEEANKMLTRAYRAPFTVPEKV